MNVMIQVIDAASQKKAAFKKLPVIIGRDSTADIRLDDPAVPPYQCMIGKGQSTHLTAWNLRTDTPMHVNGQEVSKADLLSGDRLTIGESQLIVHYDLAGVGG